MQPFTSNRIPRIVFGKGTSRDIGRRVASLVGGNGKVLLVADPNLERLGIYGRIVSSMLDAGHAVKLFEDIKSDPTEEQIQSAITIGRANGCNAVVCLGGGSTMDAGKLIASLIRDGGEVAAYRLAAEPLPKDRPPILCIPTTAGTGSEATSVSVVSTVSGTKLWFWGPELKSDLVILDPELTVGLPSHITAASGIDAIVHAMEAETCKSRQDSNQMYTLDAIRLGVKHLQQAVTNPRDLDARGGMLVAATYGGISIDNSGTAIAHNIAHALASLVPIHHGRAVAIAMAATLAWNVEGNAEIFHPVGKAFGSDGTAAFPEDFGNFVRKLGVKPVAEDNFPELTVAKLAAQMAAPENETMRKANIRPVTDTDLPELAKMTLSFK